MKKISSFHLFILQVESSLEPYHMNSHTNFWPCQFARSCTNMQKHSELHWFILDIQSILESRDQIGHTHFLTMPNQKRFNQLLIFVNFHELAENEAVSSICSREIVHLKILQSHWLRVFWPISQTKSPNRQFVHKRSNNKNFHYRTNSVKSSDQIFL